MPINGELLALLANQRPEDSGPVFTYGPPCDCTFCKHERNHGRPIKSIRTAWESARERAGISEFRFHDLRHTVGSRILALTGDLVAAKEFLGHADISTTLRYMHHDKGHKLTVMDTPSESRNTPEVKECQETK
jgi:integrase